MKRRGAGRPPLLQDGHDTRLQERALNHRQRRDVRAATAPGRPRVRAARGHRRTVSSCRGRAPLRRTPARVRRRPAVPPATRADGTSKRHGEPRDEVPERVASREVRDLVGQHDLAPLLAPVRARCRHEDGRLPGAAGHRHPHARAEHDAHGPPQPEVEPSGLRGSLPLLVRHLLGGAGQAACPDAAKGAAGRPPPRRPLPTRRRA